MTLCRLLDMRRVTDSGVVVEQGLWGTFGVGPGEALNQGPGGACRERPEDEQIPNFRVTSCERFREWLGALRNAWSDCRMPPALDGRDLPSFRDRRRGAEWLACRSLRNPTCLIGPKVEFKALSRPWAQPR